MQRKTTKQIQIGSVTIGNGYPIAIQSMTNTKTEDVDATVSQILELEKAGCEIVRSSVYNEDCANAIRKIRERIHIPLVADIHFDAQLALSSMENGIDKLRINPGNIGSEEKVARIVACAKMHGVPIRIGINGGSLPKHIIERYGHNAQALTEAAMEHVRILEKYGFYDIVISVKSSDVPVMVETNRMLSQIVEYPLHLGVTEAGGSQYGLVKSTAGIAPLLLEGIGDTIRVSLTGDPVQEIYAAKDILSAVNSRKFGAEIISCPTCGRTCIDVEGISGKIQKMFCDLPRPIKIAVMGCIVNGPGEAKEADIGIAGGKDDSLIFKKGVILSKVSNDQALDELKRQIDIMTKED